MIDKDTICAISTPSGTGGIGIIRVSGERSHEMVRRLFVPKNGEVKQFLSHRMYLGYIIDPETAAPVDEVLVVFMRAPRTYTKEDMAEIHAHGGYASQRKILDLLLREGARMAGPGEFTKRAFLNGRIDLVQAEAVLDIVRSETEEELRCALHYLTGHVTERLNLVKEKIRDALVLLEAAVDFPEEDILIDMKGVYACIEEAKKEVEELLNSFHEGRAVKQGLELLIVGRPNVGKSSLLNALLKKERAIVTSIPGTTRDLIEDVMYINGIKVRVVDSCGIRDPKDPVEEEGVRRVKERIGRVDLILLVLDGSEPYREEDERILGMLDGLRYLAVVNKIDLPQRLNRQLLEDRVTGWVEVSATKEIGIATLKERIYDTLMGRQPVFDRILITNVRHMQSLAKVRDALDRAMESLDKRLAPEFCASDLYESLHHLSELTGEAAREDLIDEIFERFCIGK